MLSNYLRTGIAASTYATISNLALKINISDSALMLSPYLRKADTLYLSNSIAAKVNVSDTASMLSKYLRALDTLQLSNRINLKINLSDSALMLSPYLRKLDTLQLSNRINLKVNISDTAAWILGYVRKNFQSASSPITYNNSTGVIGADTSSGDTHLATQNYVLNNSGNGTVTSIATGIGLSGGTITGTGTLTADTSYYATTSSQEIF